MTNGELRQIALGIALVLLPVAPALADSPLFSEDFSSATYSGGLAVADFSEEWSSTNYYWTPVSAGWSFSSGALLAVNGVTADKAILLNESPTHGSAVTVSTIGGFVAGQTYRLTFDHWGDNRPNSFPYEFDIKLDSTLLGHLSRTYGAPGPGATASYDFNATQTSYSLSFWDVTNSGQASAIIDNISISAIPEPETYAMLLAGLGLMGFVARRRGAKTAA